MHCNDPESQLFTDSVDHSTSIFDPNTARRFEPSHSSVHVLFLAILILIILQLLFHRLVGDQVIIIR
jgi:hypothetical protein